MKRNSSASPNWLVIALVGLAFAMVVGTVKRVSLPKEDNAQRAVVAPEVVAKRKAAPPRAEAAVKGELPPPILSAVAAAEPVVVEDPLEEWRVRSNGVWSVCEAATAGNMEVLLERVREGENVNARDEMGNTPLHLAAVNGHVQVVYALLKVGADPLAVNKEGKRPAELAANEAVRAACEEGEKPRRREIALFEAVRAGRLDEVQLALKDGVNPNALSEDSQHSLLTTAAAEGQVEVARALLAAGADPRYREPSSRYALNLAAGRGSVEIIEMLLAAGADPMAHTNHGAYPIHDAIWSGRTAAAIALIPCYKGINFSPDGRGNGYPVAMAISRGNREVLRAFLKAGLKPNDDIFSKEPLLVMAAKRNDAEMVRMLLDAGADKNAKDAQGKCAADYAGGDVAALLK